MSRPTRSADFRGDECGAFMVMGIFMSLFLVAALWSIAGTGEAVLFRERLQEAADAAALGAASVDARAMNLIVLSNIVAASIMSVRIAMVAMMIIGGVPNPPSGNPIPPLGTPATVYVPLPAYKPLGIPTRNQLYIPYDGGIVTAISALNVAQSTIKSSAPAAAAQNAVDMSARYEPTVNSAATVTEGTAVGASGNLPISEGGGQGPSYDDLCQHASELAFPDIPALGDPDTLPPRLLLQLMSAVGTTLAPAGVWHQILESGAWYGCELSAASTIGTFDVTDGAPGYPSTQIFTTVGARGSGLPMGAALVDLAAQGHHNTPALNLAKNAAVSEAEFFFDCPNVWGNTCQNYADWTVAWATRLRLFNMKSAQTTETNASDLATVVTASSQLLYNTLSADVTAGGTQSNDLSKDMLQNLQAAQSNQLPLLH